jgi:hypothetical protein
MATVKLEPVEDLKSYERYLSKGDESDIHETGPEGLEGQMCSAIKDEHARVKNKRMEHEAFTLYQSWHANESNSFPVEKYNQMGRELAEKWAPGHLAWVVTHTDTDKTHNHIVICSVHSETGKALSRKKGDLKRLHEINNSIAKENGMALNLPRVNDLHAKLPDHVRKIVAMGKQSWLFDMVEKIDFARTASTNFDEFVGQLKTLGVDAHVENKNISYSYGDRKPKRGKSLGTLFDKEGLMKTFKENDEKFAKHPGLRDRIRSDIGAAFDGKGNSLGTPSDLLLESASHPGLRNKDYSKFTKISRSHAGNELPAIFDERGGALYNEMKRAQQVSILDYCASNKIKTKQNENGQTVLHGKEFVVLSKSEWTNTKNKTKGTIIDFVAIHDETNFIRAVAKINANPRLLLLEQVTGEYKRSYQSFYFPKPKQDQTPKAATTLNRFLGAKGIHGDAAKSFLGNKNVHIGIDSSVWMMGEKGDSAMEFKEDSKGQWKSKRHGNAFGVFMESVGKSKQATVFRDPFDFALFNSKGAAAHKGGGSVLVLFGDEGSHRKLTEFFALNPHVSELHLAHSGQPEKQEIGRALFDDLKKRFNPFDIHVKELSLADSGKERGRGPDISF